MWKFKLLTEVKKITEDKHFHFSGCVVANFISIDGIRCCVVQHPDTKAMHIATEASLVTMVKGSFYESKENMAIKSEAKGANN